MVITLFVMDDSPLLFGCFHYTPRGKKAQRKNFWLRAKKLCKLQVSLHGLAERLLRVDELARDLTGGFARVRVAVAVADEGLDAHVAAVGDKVRDRLVGGCRSQRTV